MGFRGEALAAIASVSRIDLMTKTAGSITGTSLRLEAGNIVEESEAGCPDGTTIIIRDLFYNTPARMKFMKSDTVEGSRVTAAVQMQALAHPEVAFQLIRDGKNVLSTPGNGGLQAAVYSIYGRDFAQMVKVESRWDQYSLTGYVSKPTDARPSRALQTFFVNNRPVKSKLLVTALEEAYRNRLMVGKFPACVLHLNLPASAVDVNVHPAKTEVKFLSEKAVFDCVHYGVLAALNKAQDRPQMQFRTPSAEGVAVSAPKNPTLPSVVQTAPRKEEPKVSQKADFYRTMTAEEYKTFQTALRDAPQPKKEAAIATAAKIERAANMPLRESVMLPTAKTVTANRSTDQYATLPHITQKQETLAAPVSSESCHINTGNAPEMEQTSLEMPPEIPWRLVGELYNSYIIVEQGDDSYLIDKHAAHERILFEKLKANQEAITAQSLLTPIPVRLSPAAAGELLSNQEMLTELGFEIDEFGESTVLLRQIPMDLGESEAAETIETLAADLLSGRREKKSSIRDELLHTVACKAAIKAGWKNDEKELLAVAEQVMSRDDLKHCPHGRPICISLSKKQLEKQFKRT